MSTRKMEVAQVNHQARAFARVQGARVAEERKLHASRNREKLVNSQHAWPEEDHAGIAARQRGAGASRQAGVLTGQLGEDAPVPGVAVGPPRRRTVAIDEGGG